MPAPSPETVDRMRLALVSIVSALYETEDGLDYDKAWTAETLDVIAEAVGREHILCPDCGGIRLFGDPATCDCVTVTSEVSSDTACPALSDEDNCNCLEGMRCPDCGAKGPFSIVSSCAAIWDDDGTDDVTDVDFDEESNCRCVRCDHSARVRDFRTDTNHMR